ncbi:hypothetical protein F4679DRAFT_580026 [Xylaria curta]|nr:hypothetical protein F4679DRAFT_580026 [Xylaria curta]
MDDYEYDRLMNECLFPPDKEDNFLATIDPAMLQDSVSAFEYHSEQQQEPIRVDQPWPVQLLGGDLGSDLGPPAQAIESQGALHNHASSSHAGQHLIVSKSPFVCNCGRNFTRLSSLERHVQNNTKQLNPVLHPCAECTTYQGKNGFKRRDHLIQHLRVLHKWNDDQLATLSSTGQNYRLKISVCHFPECDYYRAPGFKDMGIREQAKNRPFDKQSHYTDHMKREHDWSPYPCKVSGCSKVNGSGFFSTTTLERHYKEKHPGSAIPVPDTQGYNTGTANSRVAIARNA